MIPVRLRSPSNIFILSLSKDNFVQYPQFDIFTLMIKEEIISKVKTLNLPKGSYVFFGSCPLAVAGIREANDIDLMVSEELFTKLSGAGWQEQYKGPNDVPIVHDVFEAYKSWNFSSYRPTLEQLIATATVIDGVPFASLEEVRSWKAMGERPKDLADLALIDKYLEARKTESR
jgi:hypothetical protein